MLSTGYLIIQNIDIVILGGWLVSMLIALFRLRRSRLAGFEQALWALMIVAIPLLGALAFLIVHPGRNDP